MRIGTCSIRHPKVALAAWVAFVLAAVALGAVSGTKTLDNGAVGESQRGYAVMDEERLWPPARELAYIRAPHGRIPAAVVRDVERRFRAAGLTPKRALSPDRGSAIVST